MEFSVLMTDYYQGFSCTGSACAYNCCQNWNIELTRADYNKIRSAKKSAALAENLKQGMKRHKNSEDDKYAFFVTNNQQCAMLREDGLCELHAECGHKTLPKVCRIFPRNTGVAKDLILRSCSAGCPEIMKNLMLREQPLTFVDGKETLTGTGVHTFVLDEATRPFARHYKTILEVCVDILQNRSASLRERVLALGMALSALDKIEQIEQKDGPQEAAFEQWKQQYAALGTQAIEIEAVDSYKAIVSNLMLSRRINPSDSAFKEIEERVFTALNATLKDTIEVVSEQPQETPEEGMVIEKQVKTKTSFEKKAYTKARERLLEAYNLDAMLENIMVNYIFSMGVPMKGETIWQEYLYFCQLYSYFQFIAVGCYTPEKGIDGLIRDLTICYRGIVHSGSAKKTVVDHMQENDCNTLAQMAILVSV